MNRPPSLLCRLLLICLASVLVLGPARAHGQGDEFADITSLTSVESRRRALDDLASVAERLRREGDVTALARTLQRIGELHLKLNDPGNALPVVNEALDLSRKAGDAPLLADALVASGVVSRARDDGQASLRLLDEAHELSLRLNYRRGEAQSLTELGTTYYQQSEMGKAVDCGERALQIWRELQDRRGEARTLSNLGAPYMRLGRARESADVLGRAAALWRELGSPAEQASALLDLNFLAIRQGQWHTALALLNEARPLVTDKAAEPFISGQIATSLGEVYEAYGQLETAHHYYEEALTLYRDYAHDAAATIDVGSKAGSVLARLDDYPGAVRQIEEGLRLAQKHHNHFLSALCHKDLGKVHLAAGFHAQAKQEFLQASTGYEQAGDRREWALTQAYLGQSDYALGDLTAAATSYHNSLEVFRAFEDYTNEAAVRFGLGKLELERQNLEAAEAHLKRSIDLTEQLRENAASTDLRGSFLASVHDRYESYVEWLMQLDGLRPGEGFAVKAFEVSEMGRARSLQDSLQNYQRELRQAADPALLLEEESLQKEEQRLLDRRAQLQSGGGAPEVLEAVESDLMQVRARHETLEARISSAARFNNLLRPAPLGFEEIRNRITDAETSLLEFSLGGRRSYLWVVTRDGLTSYELPDKQTIETAALKLANLSAEPQTDPAQQTEIQSAAADLSKLIFGPAAGKLRSPRLIVVPDGILQYVPFQILNDPQQPDEPLIASHEIINAPSASTLLLLRQETAGRPSAPKLLAAFGDPVFPSNYSVKAPTTTRGGTSSSPQDVDAQRRGLASTIVDTLDPAKVETPFFTKQELTTLRKLVPADESLIYSEFDATRDHLRELDLRQYRILHFATHGLLNAKQPELSGLVLSLVDREGRPVSGFVGLSDIYSLRAPVDLVVLSACRTGLGKEMRGEGLIGLTRGFMYAGASSVVSSLWKVDDKATAELMKRFYTNMLQRGMTPAAALRAAQNSIRQEPQWQSPYYWAAFTLQGEYRQVIKSTEHNPASFYLKMFAVGAVLALLTFALCRWWWWRRRAKGIARLTTDYSTMKK